MPFQRFAAYGVGDDHQGQHQECGQTVDDHGFGGGVEFLVDNIGQAVPAEKKYKIIHRQLLFYFLTFPHTPVLFTIQLHSRYVSKDILPSPCVQNYHLNKRVYG